MTIPADTIPPRPDETNRLIWRAAVAIGVATVCVRLLGLVKNQAIALQFGVGINLEVFLVATMLPTYAFGVLANTLPSALIPTYAAVLGDEGREAVRRLVANVMGWSVTVLLAVSLIIALLWEPILALIGGKFSPDEQRLCTRLFFVLLPGLVLHGIASLWAAVLNAEKRFLIAVLAPGTVPIATAVVVLALAPKWGPYALAVGYLAGIALEFVILALAAWRAGQPVFPARPRRSRHAARVLAQYLPVLGGGLLMSSTTVVDQAMAAALLPAGSLATLTYADVIVGALLSVAAMALGTAILPYLADMAQAGDHLGIRSCLVSNTRLILWVGVPISAALYFGPRPLVSLFFERGEFVAANTDAVGAVLAMYALQMPFYAIGILCARIVSSLHANAVLFRVSVLGLAANVGLNLAFIPSLGTAGIALSTTLVYLLSTSVMWWWIQRRLAGFQRA